MSEPENAIEFRPIQGFPNYLIGNDGTVISLFYGNRKALKHRISKKSGHHRVVLFDGKRHNRFVHHLVLEAFVCHRPDGMQGRHLDDNQDNNHVTNLAWGTHLANVRDAFRNGSNPNWKLSEDQAIAVLVDIRDRLPRSQIMAKHGVSNAMIKDMIRRRSWRVLANKILGQRTKKRGKPLAICHGRVTTDQAIQFKRLYHDSPRGYGDVSKAARSIGISRRDAEALIRDGRYDHLLPEEWRHRKHD